MAEKKKPSAERPRCPKCGGNVAKGGTANYRGGGQGQQRYECSGCGWHGTQPVGKAAAESTGIDTAISKQIATSIRKTERCRYVITAAQNATPVRKPFFASLITYCRENGARLVVIPYRYKNPTSMWSAKAENDDWWAPELASHILDRRVDLNKHLILLADIKTQPTANSPLQGFETLTAAQSAIIGHPKLELSTVATPQARLPKILTTTGAVTERNYIESKAGKKGEHHHTFGACVVEIDGGAFHMRQINATRAGSFIDLDREYDGGKSRAVKRLAGLVLGDLHEEFKDPFVMSATFGDDGIVAALRPEQVVYHDVHDFYSQNHHHRGEVFVKYVKHHTRADNVERALDQTFAFLDSVTGRDVKNIFVPSNHPDALARWVKETDPRSDPENCVFWAETFKAMCLGAKMTDTGARTIDPFAYWGLRKMKTADQAVFLEREQAYQIKGIEVGYHGDIGMNGARGSRASFGKIGAKTVIGHSHSPGIKDGVYQVGTSSRYRLEYARGPSSWLHTHCLIYENGKRSLANIIDGRWRMQ